MQTGFSDLWPILLAVIQFGGAIGAAIHAMLNKSDERAAAGWVGFIVLVPFVGWIVYLLFGINRIQRRARELRGQKNETLLLSPLPPSHGGTSLVEQTNDDPKLKEMESFARFGQKVLAEGFEPGNAISVLENGDEAYPAMIAAIEGADRSIALSTSCPAKKP